jgi:hypothetical protein
LSVRICASAIPRVVLAEAAVITAAGLVLGTFGPAWRAGQVDVISAIGYE